MSSPELTPQQRLLLGEPLATAAATTPQQQAGRSIEALLARQNELSQQILDRLGDLIQVREQYRWVEEKKVTLPFVQPPYYEIKTTDAAMVLIITDSVIQFSLHGGVTGDSPQLAGTASLYDKLAVPIEELSLPRRFFATLVSGSGNVWLVVMN